ncbi:hypothetical protein [Paraburkholderia domus]|uniref:hypothetical protein n=1 Tax=Paraburkholderia domus TaxID=2793075 RepID=UPI001913EFC2|nr:hypothetical protein [Paraburkholderia domus]MBK5065996.1 hypothetical protein [Burkholderia sp. R-70199]
MEHLVRVLDERDRRTLAWLREHVGDAELSRAVMKCGTTTKPYLSAVCRQLGIAVPQLGAARRRQSTASAQQSLAAIRGMLKPPGSGQTSLVR